MTKSVALSKAAVSKSRQRQDSESHERNCSVSRTIAILSDAWTFLVIREAFFGARRFEEFRSSLHIPRGTLTDRLKKLTLRGIFRQVHYSATSSRLEYHLTKSGMELYPSFVAMIQFGDKWLAGPDGPPLKLIHGECGCVSHPFVACSHCQAEVKAVRVTYRDGPGAGQTPVEITKRVRRTSDSTNFSRGRPSSVSRTLEIIGDRWSFLILREAFFGVRRFDRMIAELRISSNILTDRLSRLVADGIFERRKYQDLPERFEYILTAMGKALYGPFVVMAAWGDKWLSGGEPPLLLTHKDCNHDFIPTVICDQCKKPIEAQSMKYRMSYNPLDYGSTNMSERGSIREY